jgi:hypothetical protein
MADKKYDPKLRKLRAAIKRLTMPARYSILEYDPATPDKIHVRDKAAEETITVFVDSDDQTIVMQLLAVEFRAGKREKGKEILALLHNEHR